MALLIDQGADILYVSRFLAHKDIRITANVYGHLFPQRGQEIAESMSVALQEALERARPRQAVGNAWGFGLGYEVVEQELGDRK